MEAFKALEARIKSLIEVIGKLKEENERLHVEKAAVEARCLELETFLEKDSSSFDKLKEEQELTKMAVDDLIKSIDTLVEHEEQAQ